MELEVPQGILEVGPADPPELVADPQGALRDPDDPARIGLKRITRSTGVRSAHSGAERLPSTLGI
jgi:hypothetical protein